MAYPRNFERIEKFSTWLKASIRDAGFPSARQFSLAVGIKESTTSRILNAKTLPDEETILKIAKALEKPTHEVMVAAGYPVGTSFAVPEIVKITDKKMPKDLKKILEQQEIMFSGTPLDEEDKQEILDIIQYRLYKRAKELNKRKPKGEKS